MATLSRLGRHLVATATGLCVHNCPACARVDRNSLLLGLGLLALLILPLAHRLFNCGHPIVGAFLAWAYLCLLPWAHDRYVWNDGHCRTCGWEWVWFDTDSQGGRGYKCYGQHHTWISWPWVDSDYAGDKPLTIEEHLAQFRAEVNAKASRRKRNRRRRS